MSGGAILGRQLCWWAVVVLQTLLVTPRLRLVAASIANPNPMDVVLVDGAVLKLRLVGSDDGAFEVNDANGHPVRRVRPKGGGGDDSSKGSEGNSAEVMYEYAELRDGILHGLGVNVSSVNAAALGLHDWRRDLHDLRRSEPSLRRRRRLQQQFDRQGRLWEQQGEGTGSTSSDDQELQQQRRRRLGSTTGVMKNLVVLVRFADHVDRCLPPQSDFDELFNADTASVDKNGACVTTIATSPLPTATAIAWGEEGRAW
jgi:hypothetical protein